MREGGQVGIVREGGQVGIVREGGQVGGDSGVCWGCTCTCTVFLALCESLNSPPTLPRRS